MAIGGAEAIGELAIKVVPDTSTFGKDVNSGVGTSVSKASGIALGAITAVGGGLIALGTQLDSAYDGIRIGTGATGEALAGLEDSFSNVAANVPNDLESVGTAIADLNTRLGLTGPELEGLAQQFLDLSSITETDVGTNIENVTGLFNQFNVAAEDQAGVLDTLFRASQASGASLDTLTNAYNKNGAGLEALGFTLEEGVALLATFEKNGIDAARGSAGLNKVLKEATDLGIPAEQALSDLADSFKNAGSDADAAALGIEVFGARGGPQLANAIRSGNIQLDDLVGNLKASTDSIGDVQDETADAAETFGQLKNQLAIALGPAANKLFSSLGEAATNAAPAIVMVVEALTPLIEAFASLPAPVLAVVIGALAVGATASKIIGPIGTLTSVIKTLFAVVAANPYILLIAATIALVVIIVKNWDTIKEWIDLALTFIADKITAFVEWVKPYWDAVWAAVSTTVSTVVGVIQTILSTYIAIWTTIIQTGLDIILGIFQTVWDAIVGVINTARGAIDSAIGAVRSVITGVGDALETVRAIATTAWDWIVGRFIWARDQIKKLAGEIKDAALGALGPLGDVIGGVGGAIGGAANLLGFDDGGVVPGPKGAPRLILAHGGETVLPTHKYPVADIGASGGAPAASGGSGGGMMVNGPLLQVTGPVTVRSDEDIVELSRAFARETQKTYRAAGRQTGA